MDRAIKAQFVDDIRGPLLGAPLLALADYKGITVAEVDAFRRACEAKGLRYQVVKNTLCRRALEGSEREGLGQFFKGNIGVVFSNEDPIASAKALREMLKDSPHLKVQAGYFDGEVLSPAAVDKVADLPSREELLSMLLRTVQEGPRQVLGVLQGPARDLLYVLNNYAAKLEESQG